MDGALPVSYPLESMAKPESLGRVAATGSAARVCATYAASAFGLSGDPVMWCWISTLEPSSACHSHIPLMALSPNRQQASGCSQRQPR